MLPEHHGAGIGARLLDTAIPSTDGRDLLTEVAAGNARALRVYDRSGFLPEREEPGPAGTRTLWLRRPADPLPGDERVSRT